MSSESDVVVDDTVTRCAYGDGKRALHTLRLEGQGYFVVCTLHKNRLDNKDKGVRCQYCGVPIKDDWRKSPIGTFTHVPNCPRSDKEVLEIG